MNTASSRKRNARAAAASSSRRPSRADAEAAVRILLRWAGDDPDREGLRGTPSRVVRSYEEFFAGYDSDPVELLKRTFEEIDGYDEMVVLRDIRFESFCEHHIAPIIGRVHIAYLPDRRVIGISKLGPAQFAQSEMVKFVGRSDVLSGRYRKLSSAPSKKKPVPSGEGSP